EQVLWGHYQQRNTPPNHGFRENAQNDELYCDLRYQGQIEDRESGLYYNVNRYYDADSGQYLSPDPIGFAGGLRPQAYVFNPLDWVDPLGLAGVVQNINRKRCLVEKSIKIQKIFCRENLSLLILRFIRLSKVKLRMAGLT
ncbi:RHS repeat-associated core domain-containing protein, partial [Vibrio sp. V15_P4S5T153]|uniref:RHS repeat-associated core domain-containing protein n=1 Tax=Vibrio sp. V15_P4S5T153 TaxID=1938669 RepID=UPI000B9F6F48